MKFTVVPPLQSVISNSPGSKIFPVGVGLEKFRIADIITWIMEGRLIGYHNNRGGENGVAKLDAVMPNEIADNLDVEALGTCLVGIDANGKMMLGDFHNRAQGLMFRYWMGKMSPSELNSEVAVRLVPLLPFDNFVKKYIKVNNVAHHNSRGRITNTDLAYGKIFSAVCDKLTGNACTQFKSLQKFLSMFSYVAYAMTIEDVEWRFPEVYNYRGEAAKSQNTPAGTVKLNADQVTRLASAIEMYDDYSTQLREGAGEHLNLDKILTAAGWFGMYVVDRTRLKPQMPANKTLARRTLSKYDQMVKVTSILMHGTYEDRLNCYTQVMKMMTTS